MLLDFSFSAFQLFSVFRRASALHIKFFEGTGGHHYLIRVIRGKDWDVEPFEFVSILKPSADGADWRGSRSSFLINRRTVASSPAAWTAKGSSQPEGITT